MPLFHVRGDIGSEKRELWIIAPGFQGAVMQWCKHWGQEPPTAIECICGDPATWWR